MFYEVIPTKLFRKDAGILTYASEEELLPGQIVEVPLGKSKTTAIILKPVSKVDFKTKSISKIIYKTPLPNHIVKSILWLSKYYNCPLPQVAKMFLPSGITKNRRKILQTPEAEIKLPLINLNNHQKQALEDLESPNSNTKLLHGITGSGKTNIYLKIASTRFSRNESTILLVPEIALTSQLVQVFKETFGGHIILIHSKQTESERHQIWEQILTAKTPYIVIGPRSALLAPVKNLGAIIIDEAHESTYYQENTPKYSALRLASFMAKTLNKLCMYGTATPLVADYYLANSQKSVVTLSEKAKDTAIEPTIKVIDIKDRQKFTKNKYFSDELLAQITNNLKNHHQTLIFHNRRGSAPLTVCEDCGWQSLCPNCFLPLTLHTDSYSLICHTCGHQQNVPTCCPECQKTGIIHKGFGTKLLESELTKLFKNAKIARFDADNTKDQTMDQLFSQIKAGEYDIIIGTQSITKGFDLPLLATVGIVQADAGLSLPDYSAEEKTYQLLTQVIGRVGRGHLNTASVIIQSYKPDHPVITHSISGNYSSFYDYLIKKRRKQFLPPYCYIAKVSFTFKTESTTIKHIRACHKSLKQCENLLISAPTPAFHERTSSGYTWQILLKSTSRQTIINAINDLPEANNIHFSIDPPTLL